VPAADDGLAKLQSPAGRAGTTEGGGRRVRHARKCPWLSRRQKSEAIEALPLWGGKRVFGGGRGGLLAPTSMVPVSGPGQRTVIVLEQGRGGERGGREARPIVQAG
jgi:hypothetical protein